MRRFVGRRVGRKLSMAVSAILTVSSLFFVAMLLRVSRGTLGDLNDAWLDILTDSVSGSIVTVMEQGHGSGFRRVVRDAAEHEKIEAIRVLNLQGKIAFSADPGEQGQQVEDEIAARLPILARGGSAAKWSEESELAVRAEDLPAASEVMLRTVPGRIVALRPILNEEACRRCHARDLDQLGVLQISVSTAGSDLLVARFQRLFGTLAFLPVLFVVATILLMTRVLVTRPLKSLTTTIQKASQGDFLHRAHVPGSDEIATLAADFNGMLGRITTLTAMNLERERELAAAQEEMKARAALDEKAKLIETANRELGERNRELAILFEFVQQINSTLDLPRLFESLTSIVAGKLGYRQFVVLLMDASRDLLVVKATHGFDEAEEIRGMTFRKGEGIAGECARTGERILIPDTRKDSRFLHYKGKRSADGALLCVPMKAKDQVMGVLAFERSLLEGFSESEIAFLTAITNAAAIAIENAQLYARTRELSATDELTKVANRRAFQERLEHELRRADRFHRQASLLMVDIDYFKRFNDTHGHLEGDQVLAKVAELFRENVREVDLVSRFGGEEFVILLPDADKVEAAAVAEKLRSRVFRHRFPHAETQPTGRLTISVGVASYPGDATDSLSLVESADFALYRAKDTGRNRVVVFDETLRRDLDRQRLAGKA